MGLESAEGSRAGGRGEATEQVCGDAGSLALFLSAVLSCRIRKGSFALAGATKGHLCECESVACHSRCDTSSLRILGAFPLGSFMIA